jgi:putative transport protein
MLVTILTGILFGRLKIKNFYFGISGILFSGLFIGWGIMKYARSLNTGHAAYRYAEVIIRENIVPQDFFFLFLILFICSIGLSAASDLKPVLKKYGFRFIILSAAVTFTGIASSYSLSLLPVKITHHELAGIYAGALTSSPGLGAALETAGDRTDSLINNFNSAEDKEKNKFLSLLNSLTGNNGITSPDRSHRDIILKDAESKIGTGYTISYPMGIVVVLLSVFFLPKIFRINIENEKKKYLAEMGNIENNTPNTEDKASGFNPGAFSIVLFLGFLLGSVNIPVAGMGNFSLGATGGILIMALLLGYKGKVGPMNFNMDKKALNVITQISTLFGFSTIGLRFGFNMIENLSGQGLIIGLYSIFVAFISIFTGFILGYFIMKINWTILSGALCGAMTSTPGLLASVESVKSEVPAAGYGTSYPFGLLFMVIFTIILYNLPL